MVKTVFDNDMCAHVWAQQTQAEGRGSKGSVFFEGTALYSYGHHYLTGFIINNIAFLNTNKHSITTTRHQSRARQASCQYQQVFLPDLTQLRYALIGAKNGYADKSASVVKTYLESHPEIDIRDAAILGRLFGFKVSQIEAMKRAAERKAARALKEEQARELREAIREAEWLADMSDERFTKWRGQMYCNDRERPITWNDTGYLADYGKRAAKRLFKARKLGKARRFSAKRLATLLAREKTIRAWTANLETLAAQQLAAHLVRFRAEYEAAATDAERYNVASRNSVTYWRNQIGSDHAEAALLDSALAVVESERAKQRIKEQEKEREQFNAWQRGENVRCPYSFFSDENGKAYIARRGEQLVTSQGASVPWDHAVKAFRFIKLCRETARPFHTNGRVIRVGHFTVESIDENGNMVAGCHRFSWEEIERLAKAEGVFDAAPDASIVETR